MNDCPIAMVEEKQFNFLVRETPFFAREARRAISKRRWERLQEKDR